PYDCRICNPCACPPAPHGGAKAHRLKAGGFNLSMENKQACSASAAKETLKKPMFREITAL
ncbi:hypothetical protein, partial [Pseudomonas aeruginosa]|uniref:hypothetical protein n=1 Tax=Pseudomonas aeruginosa TaxID=287 RepID=UPI002FBE120E